MTSDQTHNMQQLYLRSCTALGLEPEDSSWFEVVGELETQAQGHDCFNAVITFALKDKENYDFLRSWNDGDQGYDWQYGLTLPELNGNTSVGGSGPSAYKTTIKNPLLM